MQAHAEAVRGPNPAAVYKVVAAVALDDCVIGIHVATGTNTIEEIGQPRVWEVAQPAGLRAFR